MPKKGWMTIIYIATFDHGTDDVLGISVLSTTGQIKIGEAFLPESKKVSSSRHNKNRCAQLTEFLGWTR